MCVLELDIRAACVIGETGVVVRLYSEGLMILSLDS